MADFKIANSQKIFVKTSWIGSWVDVKSIDAIAQPCETVQCKGKNRQKMHFLSF